MTITVDFNDKEVMANLNARIKLCQKKLDTQVLKDSNYYCPQDTSMLQKSAIIHTIIGSGLITWRTPYARKQYYGCPNKSHQHNPNARMKWFEAAKSVKLKYWEKLVNDEYHKNN